MMLMLIGAIFVGASMAFPGLFVRVFGAADMQLLVGAIAAVSVSTAVLTLGTRALVATDLSLIHI